MDTYVYEYNDKLYINLTNKCNNDCAFCIRHNREGIEGYKLWLQREPEAEDIIGELEKREKIENIVFCGFGEPLFRLDTLLQVAGYAKKRGIYTRLNTNGQADLIAGEGTAKKLIGKIDRVSISLNATDAKKYAALCNPERGEEAYRSMLKFAKECVEAGIDTVLSVVDIIGEEEISKAQKIADSIGARLRVRKYE
jgi:TatD family-associated radical SAM protein